MTYEFFSGELNAVEAMRAEARHRITLGLAEGAIHLYESGVKLMALAQEREDALVAMM
jgi:hypothetical protein